MWTIDWQMATVVILNDSPGCSTGLVGQNLVSTIALFD